MPDADSTAVDAVLLLWTCLHLAQVPHVRTLTTRSLAALCWRHACDAPCPHPLATPPHPRCLPFSGRPAITMWSSGTGFAGVFGYAWVALLHLFGATCCMLLHCLCLSTMPHSLQSATPLCRCVAFRVAVRSKESARLPITMSIRATS